MDTTTQNDLTSELQERYMARTSLLQETDQRFIELGDADRTLGQGFYRLAKVYYDKADFGMAQEYFLNALDKTVYPRDAYAMLKIYGFLIRIYAESLDEARAEEMILNAEGLIKKLSQELGSLSAEYFYNAGMVSNYRGDFEKSLESFKFAYQKAQTENEPGIIAKSLYAISTALYNLNRHNEALNYLEQLKELLNILKKDYLKGSMFMLYGNIYKDLGKLKDSMDHYDRSIQLLQSKNCWNLFGYILLGKGIVLKKRGEYSQAMTFFNLGLNTMNEGYQRLKGLYENEVEDVNDSSVDLYLDRHNRIIHEKTLGKIDFKHRFVLLEILFLLVKNPGSPYNKDDLARSIWKDEYNPLIHDKLIYTSISRLRKLIEPKGGARKYIIRGKDGYTFNPRANARFHKETEAKSNKIIGNVEISSPV